MVTTRGNKSDWKKCTRITPIVLRTSGAGTESTDFAQHFFEKTLRYFNPSAQSALFREIRVQVLLG
jgi:hypothetical protein